MKYLTEVAEYLKEAFYSGYSYGVSKRVLMSVLDIKTRTREWLSLNSAMYELRKDGVIKVLVVDGKPRMGYYIYVPEEDRGAKIQKIHHYNQ